MSDNLNKSLKSSNADALISAAAGKLGCSAEELKKRLQSGQLEQELRSAKAGTPLSKAAGILSDPKAVQKLMSDPAAAELIRKLSKGR